MTAGLGVSALGPLASRRETHDQRRRRQSSWSCGTGGVLVNPDGEAEVQGASGTDGGSPARARRRMSCRSRLRPKLRRHRPAYRQGPLAHRGRRVTSVKRRRSSPGSRARSTSGATRGPGPRSARHWMPGCGRTRPRRPRSRATAAATSGARSSPHWARCRSRRSRRRCWRSSTPSCGEPAVDHRTAVARVPHDRSQVQAGATWFRAARLLGRRLRGRRVPAALSRAASLVQAVVVLIQAG